MNDVALKTADVMKLLNVKTPEAVYNLVAAKKLAAVRVGREYRFFPEAIEAFRRGETQEQAKARRTRKGELPAWARVPAAFK